jgi:type IV pilus assembly protein PilV
MMHHLHNDSGLTLLEVLITMLILSVGLLGMVGLTTGIMRGSSFSRKVTTATTVAEEKMEEMRRLGYAGIPAADTTTTEDYHRLTHYPLYKRITSTQMMNPSDGMKVITVTVLWDSDAHSVSFKTILAE